MRLLRKQGTVQRAISTGALSILFIMTIALAGVSPAAGLSGTAAPFLPRAGHEFDHRAELRKVLSVVEHRTKDGKVLERMREKLSAMSDRNLRLAASLCERIAHDDDSAGADFAFSIVTALIVLS
jgi:hypothetical protein